MFPYSWFMIFSISVLAFFLINSSWSSFFSSPTISAPQKVMKVNNFWC